MQKSVHPEADTESEKKIIKGLYRTLVMLSSHQRHFDGALKWRAKRHQSVTKLDESGRIVIDRGEAWSKAGHSERAPNFFKLFKNFGGSVTN